MARRDAVGTSSPFQPPPTTYDPRGFAVGVIANEQIERQLGVKLRQFRWMYGHEHRDAPFKGHRTLDGRFIGADGTVDGFYPGDHSGCRCGISAVYVIEGTRRVVNPTDT